MGNSLVYYFFWLTVWYDIVNKLWRNIFSYCCFWDTRADKQTDTDSHTDTPTAILRTPTGLQNNTGVNTGDPRGQSPQYFAEGHMFETPSNVTAKWE